MKLLREISLTSIYIGAAIAYTLWASNFSDFMLLEDLGLESSEAGEALTKVSPGERVVFNMSALLTISGIVGFLIALFQRRRESGQSKPSEPNV